MPLGRGKIAARAPIQRLCAEAVTITDVIDGASVEGEITATVEDACSDGSVGCYVAIGQFTPLPTDKAGVGAAPFEPHQGLPITVKAGFAQADLST